MCADPPLADLGGEHRAKPVPPEPHGLMADVDPALGQEILDVGLSRWRILLAYTASWNRTHLNNSNHLTSPDHD